MNNTYTFESLTSSVIPNSDNAPIYIASVVIPRIQRPYAQGRLGNTETRIRKQFIDAIFTHLVNGNKMDLHFIYGAVKKDEINQKWQLELLDGQQRITTLYLLHWYLLNRERDLIDENRKNDIVKALESFVYETRTTSTEFCKSFLNFQFIFDKDSLPPSEAIRKTRWYYNRFNNDSTIMGMLVMLDYIHNKYNETNEDGLINHLDCLQFYLLPLFNYEMSEDLYTKMNARGLPLTPFDNFKADFTGAMKTCIDLDNKVKTKEGYIISYRESIGIKLDTKWVDLFWAPNKADFDASYMLFFSRFFAYRYLVDSDVPANAMQDKNLPINTFFTQSEDKDNRNEYLGFDKYAAVLHEHPEYFKIIEKILDTLSDKFNLQSIHDSLKPIWDDMRPDNFFVNANASFSQSSLVVFGAICDFILENDTFNVDIFQQWMRIVWNVVENTNIDSLIAATGPLRNLHNLISQIDIDHFYQSVSQATPSRGETWPRAFKEEIEKARRIAEDSDWLEVFVEAEKRPYLKGSVGFYYDESLTIDEFKHIRDFIMDMFDDNGITPQYREKHLLIRAIISHLKKWNKNGLENRYVTESNDKNKRLKLLLLDNDDIRRMFVDSLKDSKSVKDVKQHLKETINKNIFSSYQGLNGWELQFAIAHNALCQDVKLYDWMETQSSPVCVSYFKGHIAVAIPRVWYNRFLIDSERDDMAIVLMSNLYMTFLSNDRTAWPEYNKFGRFKGEEILLQKGLKRGFSFRILFRRDHIIRLYVECANERECQQLKAELKNQQIENSKAEENRLYLDVDNLGNLDPRFKYFLQGEFYSNLSSIIYERYNQIEKALQNI